MCHQSSSNGVVASMNRVWCAQTHALQLVTVLVLLIAGGVSLFHVFNWHGDDDTIYVVYVTCPDVEVADGIAAKLVDKRLAACCNVVPGMKSVYRWEGGDTYCEDNGAKARGGLAVWCHACDKEGVEKAGSNSRFLDFVKESVQ